MGRSRPDRQPDGTFTERVQVPVKDFIVTHDGTEYTIEDLRRKGAVRAFAEQHWASLGVTSPITVTCKRDRANGAVKTYSLFARLSYDFRIRGVD